MTWLRLLSIFGIVNIHNTTANALYHDATRTEVGAFAIATNMPFMLAVPALIMVSGALALDPAHYHGPWRYLRKRSLRILLPLVFWNLFYIAAYRLMSPQSTRSVGEWWQLVWTGKLTWHLYFFWIVLGLSVLTPVLVPLVRRLGRWGAGAVGLLLAAVPPVLQVLAAQQGSVFDPRLSPLTWPLPYLGLYLLGWALREVNVRGWGVLLLAAIVASCVVLITTGFRHPEVALWRRMVAPSNYYGAATVVGAIALYLIFRALPTRAIPRRVQGAADEIARVSMGIFAVHLLVLQVEWSKIHFFGEIVTTQSSLVWRWLFASVVSTVIALIAGRICFLRRLV